jgi:hypothetical protein
VQPHHNARALLGATVLHHVGDPLLDDNGQVICRQRVQFGVARKTARQPKRAGDGRVVGPQPRLGFAAELSYDGTLVVVEARMRGAIVAGLLMAALLSTTAAAGEIGRIKSVAGAAQVVRGKTAAPATAGELLQEGDVLRTGPGASIGVTFVDNSRFAVGPNSSIALSQFQFDDRTHVGQSLTTVDRGTLAVVSGQIAHENKDAMRVRTPTSVLAARGTRFVVTVG